ncbi:MAG TPA: SH3 domain-containing protein [Verrucomicrobiae bacterium]|nr:SH3 domain-containing protein [Verrucomicrobiae bacterium]
MKCIHGYTRRWITAIAVLIVCAAAVQGQTTPYARSFAKAKPEVEQALKELQGYAGQKLPVLDGFVGPVSKPLERYERGFYQFTIEVLPGDNGATMVRLSAKITAWYADRDVSKSGYDVLPSNGRLELDFLDRLEEKLTGKPVASAAGASAETPKPKLDLSGVPGAGALIPQPQTSAVAKTPDEVAALRNQRVLEERRVAQLTTQLQNLQEIQKNQAHPQNLVAVEISGTPIYAKPAAEARVLFQAAANDEFEFIDDANGWIHIEISGDSRGYVRQSAVLLPESIAARIGKEEHGPEEKYAGFRIEHDEIGNFPADWPGLKGKVVKIYTVQPVSQNAKETGPAVRLEYSLALFQKALKESAGVSSKMEGVTVIFDAIDGGIAAATLEDIQKVVAGSLTHDAFWKQSYLDPLEAFRASGAP